MKPFTNEYGYIHGGYTFYLLDKSSHNFAKNKIGDCLTGNVNIYYHDTIVPSDIDEIKIKHKDISSTKKTILIESQLFVKEKLCITGIFTFIQIKK